MRKVKLMNVVGARPNFIKIAALMKAFKERPRIEAMLVHTGQHYDQEMSEVFFRQLEIPESDINLEVGSGSHATQTAQIMKAFEPVLEQHRPDAVLVVGDVNSTIACGLVAKKMGIQLIHVEAGLRSFDRSMPEEINRVLTDAISDLLFCSEQSGVENLQKEGIAEDKIFLVGNVMIDTLLRHRACADGAQLRKKLGLHSGEYAVVTLHRPTNVDDPAKLRMIMRALDVISERLPVLLPAHPRLWQRLNAPEGRGGFSHLLISP